MHSSSGNSESEHKSLVKQISQVTSCNLCQHLRSRHRRRELYTSAGLHHSRICSICVAVKWSVCRIHANSRLETASSLQGANAGLVTRSRLRRGCQCHTVQSVLYVGHTQGKTDSANTSGQVQSHIAACELFWHSSAQCSVVRCCMTAQNNAVMAQGVITSSEDELDAAAMATSTLL